jgi:hypothetical protein
VLSPYIATNHSLSPVVAMAAVMAALVSGCSLLIDAGRDQCSSTADCAGLGLDGSCERGVCVAPKAMSPSQRADGGVDGGMLASGTCRRDPDCEDGESCFKQKCAPTLDVQPFICETPAAPPISSELVMFEMPVREFVSDKAPMGLTVVACSINDVSCKTPAGSYTDMDGTANVKLMLPRGFDGFLKVTSTDTLPGLWYFTQPLVAPRVAKPLAAVSPATLDLLAAITGLAVDASKGLVILEAFDCNGVASGGIHFEEGKRAARPFYIIDELPSLEATVTVRDAMADLAAGGFLNAPPGFTVFTARIGVDGPVLNQHNAHVQASTVTYLDIYP